MVFRSETKRNKTKGSTLPSLRWFLLMWLLGGAVLMVISYTVLLEYYLDLGVDIRTDSILLRNAKQYDSAAMLDESEPLPRGYHLQSYLGFDALPSQIREIFPENNHHHRKVLRHANRDYGDDENDANIIDTDNLCGAVNCEFIFFYPYQLDKGGWLFLVQGLIGTEQVYEDLKFTEQVAFAIGIAFFGLFLLLSILAINRVGGPLGKLENWVEGLEENREPQETPKLNFREYDALAQRLSQAFERIREDAEKEKQFLRHASHELRTPIAILSANLELIEKLTERPERGDSEIASFTRQRNALRDIQQMTETLLWLNRQTDSPLVMDTVDLDEVLESIITENNYLLAKRSVELTINSQHPKISVPTVALRIVISNLVRNAMQYTVDGHITISLTDKDIVVENANRVADDHEPAASNGSYGFGLGLDLADRICRRLGWFLEIKTFSHGYHVRVSLENIK